MRITLVNTHDRIGGAERCSYDLATELHRGGDTVELIVGRKLGRDSFVTQMAYRPLDWKTRSFVYGRLGLTDTTIAAPIYGCWTLPGLRKAEVYNLHNMHGAYWNFWTLPILARRAPLVLTLHDEWLLTGDCAYTYDCERWLERCGRCPQALESDPVNRVCIGGGRDATRVNLWLKRAAFGRLDPAHLTLVAPSRWLADRASRAPHLARFSFRVIHNGVDLQLFSPGNVQASRERFGLPKQRFLVLSLAANQFDRRKNLQTVLDALYSPGWPRDAALVVAGRLDPESRTRLEGSERCYLTGYLDGPGPVSELMGACDLTVVPSRADNLPYAALEAQACGCPVLAAKAGGTPETIEDGVTGWLFDPAQGGDALAQRIAAISRSDPHRLRDVRGQARKRSLQLFGLERFASSYRRLFEEGLESWRRRR